MSTFTVNLLGCGSAKPSVRHNQSCTVINFREALYMIDCGEGAQQQMQRMGLKFSRLRHIFITHMHGDHILGLPGLLQTLSLNGHCGKVTLHTFREGIKLIDRIRAFFGYELGYELEYHELKPEEGVVLDTPALTVNTVPLNHRVDCVGYVFREKERLRHLIPDMLEYHQVPIAWRPRVKAGEDFVKADGTVIPNCHLTRPATPSVSYAHLSDSAYVPELAEKVKGVTCVLHDATYGDDRVQLAAERGHSTARQAAQLARDAEAGKLILTHFSSAYRSEAPLLQQAQEVFENSMLANEGLRVALD